MAGAPTTRGSGGGEDGMIKSTGLDDRAVGSGGNKDV